MEGNGSLIRKNLPPRSESAAADDNERPAGILDTAASSSTTSAGQQPMVIPGADSLIGDLLDMDLGPTIHSGPPGGYQLPPPTGQPIDLLVGGLDGLLSGGSDTPTPGGADLFSSGLGGAPMGGNMMGGLSDIFGAPAKNSFVGPQEVSLYRKT